MNIDEIICGDCLEVMKVFPDKSVDAIITDLPYGTTACEWDVVIPLDKMWEQVKRICKGAFVTTASQPFTSAIVMSNPDRFKHEWIWEKDSASNPSIAEYAPMKYHEEILVFSYGSIAYHPQMWDSGRLPNRRGKADRNLAIGKDKGVSAIGQTFSNMRYPKSIIRCDRPNSRHRSHQTQKPVALYEYLIHTYTNPGDTVLDFCMGSGTTLVAAKQTGRHWIGIDISEEYCKLARRRVSGANVPLPFFVQVSP